MEQIDLTSDEIETLCELIKTKGPWHACLVSYTHIIPHQDSGRGD
jgi:hypothetical protein